MSTTTEFLRVEVKDSVATIVMDRPARRNAFNSSMWNALTDICSALAEDLSVQVVVLRSSSDIAFCAGADIAEFGDLIKDVDKVKANADSIRAATLALQNLPRPTVACIQGSCFGGGALLALACDFRIADSKARFAITPAKLGLSYSINDTNTLAKTVGLSMARRLLMLAEELDADAALQCGFVDRVFDQGVDRSDDDAVECGSIDQALQKLLEPLLQNSQYSLRNIKKTFASVRNGQAQDDAESISRFVDAFAGEDLAEGMDAFLTRRKPDFPFR